MFRGSSNGGYDYKDEFYTDRAAGAVNGTACEEGAGTRTVVDTDSKLTISSGKLNMAPHSTPAYGDPGLWIDEAITRAAGVMLKGQINITDVTLASYFGFTDNKVVNFTMNLGCWVNSDTIKWMESGTSYSTIFSPSDATDYEFLLALRSVGGFYFIKDSGIWKLIWISNINNSATLYAGIPNRTATLTSDYLRIPSERWLPIPLASDGMSSAGTTDGLGHLETTGLGSGGSGLTYTDDGTWTVAAGKAVNTPTEGAELISNGDFASGDGTDWSEDGTATATEDYTGNELTSTITGVGSKLYIHTTVTSLGDWYATSYTVRDYSATKTIALSFRTGTTLNVQSASGNGVWPATFRAVEDNASLRLGSTSSFAVDDVFTIDDVTVKPLTLSALFSSLSLSTQDVVASADLVVTAGTQAGMVICLDSAANPQNFLLPYHNGTNAILEKCVAGTYTTLISAAATYSANVPIIVHKDGTKVRLYYNNALIGSEQTVSDAGIINNKLHGKFSTYVGNTIDNLHIEARGNQGQYMNLDRY